MMAYRQYETFESIFRNKRDLNNIVALREGPYGFVPSTLKHLDGYRSAKINTPKANRPRKDQCSSEFITVRPT